MTTSNRPTESGRSGLRPIERRNVDGLAPTGSDSDGYDDDPARREDGQPRGWGDRVRNGVGIQFGRMGWLLLAAGLAFGSAGMAAVTQPQPVTGHRPELEWEAEGDLWPNHESDVRYVV